MSQSHNHTFPQSTKDWILISQSQICRKPQGAKPPHPDVNLICFSASLNNYSASASSKFMGVSTILWNSVND